MTPFNRILHFANQAKVAELEPKPNPRPFSDAEIVRARLARFLRRWQSSGQTIDALIFRLHDEPADSDWCPGYGADLEKPKDRS
jgi:hypothetical protein